MKLSHTMACLLLLTGLSENSIAASHGDTSSSAEASTLCAKVNQLPKLDCASAPSAVFSESGRLWVVWSYAGHVYVNYSDDKAKTYSQPVSVNRIPEKISARGENRPKIAINNNGGVYVSWTTPLEKRFTGHVRFSYSTNNAESFSKPITVNDNLDITGHRFDALAVAKNGDIYMAWIDKRDRLKAQRKGEKYHGAGIYYTWSDNGGKSFYPNKKIIDHSCECCRVIVETNDKSLPVILWRNIYGKNTRDHALVDFDSPDSPTKPVRVSYDNWKIDACPHHGPDLSISDSGDYHMAWFNNAEINKGLFYMRMDANKKQNKPFNFGNYKATAAHPGVLNKGNRVWLTWKEFDGELESLWSQYSDNNGDSWNKAIRVAETKPGSDHPFLMSDKDTIYIQWKTNQEGFQMIAIDSILKKE